MNDIAATLARGHALNHKNALEAVGALDDLQLRWRPARSTRSASTCGTWRAGPARASRAVALSDRRARQRRDRHGVDEDRSAVRDEDLARPAELEVSRAPWHLGMIEALKGAAGMRGPVTL